MSGRGVGGGVGAGGERGDGGGRGVGDANASGLMVWNTNKPLTR